MKKKLSCRILSVLLIVTLLGTLLAACGGTKTPTTTAAPTQTATATATSTGDTAPAKPDKIYDLSLTMHDPATSVKGKYYTAWAEEIKKATNGAVNITVYAGGTLAAANAALDAVKTGTCDMGWIFTSFFPGQFKLSDVTTLPLSGIQTSTQATKALWALYDQFPELQAETSTYKMLQMYPNPMNIVFTADKKVDSLATLKGLKLRAPAGAISDILTLWGAVPITMGPGDIYESIEKKVIDGYSFEWSGMNGFKLQEVTKNYMDMPIFCGPFFILMNKASWDKLPADLQKIVEEHSGMDSSLDIAGQMQKENDDVKAAADKAGIVGTKPSDADYAAFKAIADQYKAEWVKKNTTASFDAQKYLDKFNELVKANVGA